MHCSTCRFFQEKTDEIVATCRRYPPTYTLTEKGALDALICVWPLVSEKDWCGEWDDSVIVEKWDFK